MIQYLIFFGCILLGIIVLTGLYYMVSFVAESDDLSDEEKNGVKYASQKKTDVHVHDTRKAVIHCGVIPPAIQERFHSTGYHDCRLCDTIYGGSTVCTSGCLGAGSCAELCPNNAITLRNGTITINEYCNGCGYCINVCPRHLIELVPINELGAVYCAASGKINMAASCTIAANNYSLQK